MTLNIQNLRFSYQAHNVLDLSPVTFEQGKIYGIVGRNGVGKTTFFKTLTNIITHYSGSIEIDGQNIKENPKMLTAVVLFLMIWNFIKITPVGLISATLVGYVEILMKKERAS